MVEQHRWNKVWWNLAIVFGMVMIAFTCLLVFSNHTSSAHGYVSNPPSRAKLCADGVNQNCGLIIYEPQSLEAPKGWPNGGPEDGKIASAGGIFPELDQQSSTRWSKVNINSGNVTFTWKKTAAHATTDWKYYITKEGWNPDQPLTRASFDLQPFCTVSGGGQRPPFEVSHNCNVPQRSGYHVILAVWTIADTANAFYNVIDVQFGSGGGNGGGGTPPPPPPPPPEPGSCSEYPTWSATQHYQAGQKVVYNGKVYEAKWWTLDERPDQSGEWGVWRYIEDCSDEGGNQGPDTEPPTPPQHLHTMAVTSNMVSLMWGPSSDNVGVAGYHIYQGSTLIATVSGSTYEYDVTGLSPNTAYTFTVRAFDEAGNVSQPSNQITVTTESDGGNNGGGNSGGSTWAPGVSYSVGDIVIYNGITYECRQAHTSLSGWEPPNVPALWLQK